MSDAAESLPYYVDHFLRVIDMVENQYGHWLSPEETSYVETLRSLPKPAFYLYVRLANRKGPYFRLSKLAYPESEPIMEALAPLRAAGLLLPGEAALLTREVWQCFTHVELREIYGRYAGTKTTYCTWVEECCESWQERLCEKHPLIVLSRDDPWPFLKFLFFGKLTDNLSGFVIQELGHVLIETKTSVQLAPFFTHREEAVSYYTMSCLYAEFRTLREHMPAIALFDWWSRHVADLLPLPMWSQSLYDRLAAKVGRILEREHKHAEAMTVYRNAHTPPCRERHARLLVKSGEKEAAIALCERILADPYDSEEAYNAASLHNRLLLRQPSAARRQLRATNSITIAPVGRNVEQAALRHFKLQGWEGAHTENWPWNALFGLLLWDIIHDPAYGTFHHPLQAAPSDMHLPDFYMRRASAIEERLTLLARREACLGWLSECYAAKEGLANACVSWHEDTLAMVVKLVEYVRPEALAAVVRRMAKDPQCRKGFPDLLLWCGDAYRLIEIKSPNDQLSVQQWYWQRFLEEHGVDASILRVEYAAEMLEAVS